MTVFFIVFLLSIGLALAFTRGARHAAKRFQLVDIPDDRKVHNHPIPRVGGAAIFLAFFLSLLCGLFFSGRLLWTNPTFRPMLWVFAGSAVVFVLGLVDDIKGVNPRIKFAVQIVAASLAYAGGARISQLIMPWSSVYSFGFLSFPVTVFWFLLVINGINLIDGLDGLAAGVSLFASLTLMALSIMGGHFAVALWLAALGGACLGFLRYNFNPASIFMGDSGSYFIGYMLAALSILGSMKSQATVALLIPVVALGLPLMDTILAPIRRFLMGSELFKPDRNHIHHRLLKMGFSHRKAVLCMYGVALFLGSFALASVYSQDDKMGLLFLSLGIACVTALRKLGYLDIFTAKKMKGYFRDVSDEIGLNKDRRVFLNKQLAIAEAGDPLEMWDGVTEALALLKVDEAEIRYNGVRFHAPTDGQCVWRSRPGSGMPDGREHRILSLELPLADMASCYGTLSIKKDILKDPITHYTLGRIEHLRRSIVNKLSRF